MNPVNDFSVSTELPDSRAKMRTYCLSNNEVQRIIQNKLNAKVEYGVLFTLSNPNGWDDHGYVESQSESENLIGLHRLSKGFVQGRRDH